MNTKYSQRHRVHAIGRQVREWIQFVGRDFRAPSPTFIKMRTLTSFAIPNGVWVETGTYMGGTSLYLAKRYPKVISIEPSDDYFAYSSSRLRKLGNVTLMHGTSEDLFEDALASSAPFANIWLDGHFSEGGTFEGKQVTPVMDELSSVAKLKSEFQEIVIFIDDIRLFPKSNFDDDTGYPYFTLVTKWCEENGFKWELQNDILVARLIN